MDRVIRQSVFALVGRPPPLLSYWWARSINYSTAPRGNQTYVFPAAGKTQKERKKKEMYIYILYICYTARACSRTRDTPCLPLPTAASRADLYHFIWAIRSGTGPFIPRRCWGSPALHFFLFLFGDRGQIEWQDTLWNRKRILYKGDEHLLVEWPKDLHINRGG